MKFSEVEAVRVPNGNVRKIRHNGDLLWRLYCAMYVSLGDSIAAGHAIDLDWEKNYGRDSQYKSEGDSYTVLVPGCYTDLLRAEMVEEYGEKPVSVASFARSGDAVPDLVAKLSYADVRETIHDADLVTLCIGANDVLGPALEYLEEYIATGDFSPLEVMVEENLANLENDTHPTSYNALFQKLTEINPYAKYVFTTIYNPYKYLWLEEGTDGFFKPALDSIPQLTILGFEVDELIKRELMETTAVRQLFDRVNRVGAWAENYVTALNAILRNKIASYGKPNFLLADAKAVFDTVPDRIVPAEKHYNDLVNVEFTRGYNTYTMHWSRLWKGSDRETFWLGLAVRHTSLSGFDSEGFANDLVAQSVEKVIKPYIDPHPRPYGHYMMMQCFWEALR